jgi:hypothetical protein
MRLTMTGFTSLWRMGMWIASGNSIRPRFRKATCFKIKRNSPNLKIFSREWFNSVLNKGPISLKFWKTHGWPTDSRPLHFIYIRIDILYFLFSIFLQSYDSKLWFYFSKLQVLFLQTSGFISPNFRFYFSKVMVLFLQTSGFISSKLRLYFFKAQALFLRSYGFICMA